jgi:hypothetical protein
LAAERAIERRIAKDVTQPLFARQES